MDMQGILFIILIVILFILSVIFLPYWLVMRAVPKVIKAFRHNNATSASTARTIEELGLKPKSIFQRMFTRRDYRQNALQFLIRSDVVDITEEGKFFLNEEKLMLSKWRNL
ncbi:MAG TPA: hypothetical protein G4O20_01700 [Dehalococcoidia bacterium]|nr:hypothetical protein [Dehalococcoidia bacterium]